MQKDNKRRAISMNDAFPNLYAIYGSDPIVKVLVKRWRLRPLSLALITFLSGGFYMGGLAAVFGYLLPRPGIVASSEDYFNQVNFFLIFPVIAFYYLDQPAKIEEAYTALIQHVGKDKSWLDEFRSQMSTLSTRHVWWLACLAMGLFVIGTGTYDSISKLGGWWYSANGWMIAGLQAARGVVVYMILVVFARHIIASIGLGRIYQRFEILAPILPPSQTYGIRAVADYAFTFTALAAVVGLNIGLGPLVADKLGLDYPIQAVLYLVMAPVGFFLPLWQAHHEMVQSRNRIIDDLSAQYQSEYDQLLVDVAQNAKGIEERFKRLKTIQDTYDLIEKSWTWPFNTSTLYKVIVTILAPFSLAVLQVLTGFVSDLVAKLIRR